MPLFQYPLKKISALAVLGLAFFIPSGFYFLEIPLLAIIGVCRIAEGNFLPSPRIFKKPQLFFPIALYLYTCIQFFFSHNFGEALSSLSTNLPLLLYPLILGTYENFDRDLIRRAERWFLTSVCLSMLIVIAYAAYDVLTTHENTILIGESVYNKFSSFGLVRVFSNWHPTYVALFVNHAIIIAIKEFAVSLRKRKLSSFILPSFVFLLLSVSLFLLNSMIGFIAFIAILFYYCSIYLGKKEIDRTTSISILCLLLFCALNFLYFNPFKIQKLESLKSKELKVTDHYDERNILTIRLAKWETHLSVIQQHLWWGTTQGDIKEIREAAYKEKDFMDLAAHNYNAHNEFIETLAMYGIIGFSLFLGMLFLPFYKMENRRSYSFFIIITTLTFLTESVLNRQQGLNYFMFFYSLYTITGPVAAMKQEEPPQTA